MKSSIAAAFMGVVFGPFGVFCLAWTGIYLAHGEVLSAVVALGAAVFALGMIAMLALVAAAKVTARVRFDRTGSEFRPDRRVDRLLMTSTIAGLVAMAVYGVFSPFGMVAIRAPNGSGLYGVLTCLVAVPIGVMTLRQFSRHGGASYLKLNSDGFETGNTMTTAVRSWDEIADIADRPRNARQPNGATYFTTADGRTREFPSHWYTPRGSAIHALVRFYWQHPEARGELTDGRAVARMEVDTT